MKTVGVTIGKFWPFHYGHDLMIKSGIRVFDEMVVIVSPFQAFQSEMVHNQMKDRYQEFEDTLYIYEMPDDEEPEKDENGTALDDAYITRWAETIKQQVPDMTHFVSSDVYGKILAEKMGVEWFPVDPDREAVPISSTKIKSNLYKYWQYIVPEARYDWAKKVAIVGPESTGKSTIVKKIDSSVEMIKGVPEWGRTISEVKNNELAFKDFHAIIEVQQEMIDAAVQQAPIVITDTEAITTHMFASTFLNDEDAHDFNQFAAMDVYINQIDLYVVLAPTVPWVDDGTRVMGDQQKRREFYEELIEHLDKAKANYVVVTEDNWPQRLYGVLKAINLGDRALQEPTAKEFSK